MAHVRIQIRDAVAAQLNAIPALAGRVNVESTDPAQAPALPLVYVEAHAEQIERVTMGGRLQRTLTCQIIMADKATTPLATDDALEALAVLVEASLVSVPALLLLKDTRLVAMEKGFSGEGESEVGVLRLTYEISAHTAESDPETLI